MVRSITKSPSAQTPRSRVAMKPLAQNLVDFANTQGDNVQRCTPQLVEGKTSLTVHDVSRIMHISCSHEPKEIYSELPRLILSVDRVQESETEELKECSSVLRTAVRTHQQLGKSMNQLEAINGNVVYHATMYQ
jgi:hypothetical protein